MKKLLIVILILMITLFIGCSRNSQESITSTANKPKLQVNSIPNEPTVTDSTNSLTNNSGIIIDERDDGRKSMLYLGMTIQDAITNLNKMDMEITAQKKIDDSKSDWDYGHKVIWTEKLCCVFDQNDTLYRITVNGDIPTVLGLEKGDSLNNLEKLYGKSNNQYKFDWGTVFEYIIGSYYFNVSVQNDAIMLWEVSKYKYDYNDKITEGSTSNSIDKTKLSSMPEAIENGTNLVIKIKDKIHSSIPEYLFTVYGEKKSINYSANKILISKTGGKEDVVQEITFDKTDTPDKERLGFQIEDMNFDGYKDIRIQQFLPAALNIPYYCWLWDEKTSKYVESKELEEITSPEFDSENKIIKSFARASATTNYERIYKYVDGKPTLFRETERIGDTNKNVWHVTVKELKDNEMKVMNKYDEPLNN